MEWVLWLFLALVMSPVALMIISPLVKSHRESARELFAARQAAALADEKRRAADAKAEAARAEAAQKKAAAAARKADQERRKAKSEEERHRRQAERIAAARELAELKERQLKAEKELRALQASKPAKDPAPAAAPDPTAPTQSAPAPAAPAPAPAPDPAKAPAANAPRLFPQTFAGETVAFTGTVPTMTRAEAIRATKERGGSAYERINTHCTLLVVGERAGNQQRERARSWNIPMITWEEWFQRAEISWRRRAVAQSMLKESRAQQRPVIIS